MRHYSIDLLFKLSKSDSANLDNFVLLRIARLKFDEETSLSLNSNYEFGLMPIPRGVPRIWQGGGAKNFFFPDLEICMSRSDMLRMAKPCALLGGFGGMPPRENFLKWCNLVRFGVYFDQILTLKNFKNYHFLYKKFKNCNFLCKRINILDTRLLWGNYSREEIF